MSYNEPNLTAVSIRYLLAINESDTASLGVKSSEIAAHLGVTKPSVYTMIKKFCEKGYATKGKYEAVHLTAFGKQLAKKYAKQYALLYAKIKHSLGLSPESCRSAVCAILSQDAFEELSNEKNEGGNMQKITLKIDGMMCGMCEAHINDAIRNAFPVKKVTSSHKKGQAEILTETKVDEDDLKALIAKTGYELKSLTVEPYEKKKVIS